MGITWAAYLIGFATCGALALMIVSKARGWFKELPPSPPSQTSEQMDET